MSDEPLVSVREAAEALGLSQSTLYKRLYRLGFRRPRSCRHGLKVSELRALFSSTRPTVIDFAERARQHAHGGR